MTIRGFKEQVRLQKVSSPPFVSGISSCRPTFFPLPCPARRPVGPREESMTAGGGLLGHSLCDVAPSRTQLGHSHWHKLSRYTPIAMSLVLDEEEQTEEGEWDHGGEEHHEFAYEDHAFPRNKRRKQETKVDAASLADAFIGKHCPICLGEIYHSSSVIESCNHIYCTACLFEVRERVLSCFLHTYVQKFQFQKK